MKKHWPSTRLVWRGDSHVHAKHGSAMTAATR
jgi:hypothetical protein